MSKKILVYVVGLAVSLAALGFVLNSLYGVVTDERGKHDVETNYYAGRFIANDGTVYRADMSENDRGFGFQTMLHLRAAQGEPFYAGITGHDYNSDGLWDRIFYCGPTPLVEGNSGCNSMYRRRVGPYEVAWKFEPCAADEGNVEPFSEEAINMAIAKLDGARMLIGNNGHLISRWEWNEKERRVVEIYRKPS